MTNKSKPSETLNKSDLPHIWGWKWYPWAEKFYKSRNRWNFLCAANQISKSSTQIRKAINWATHTKIWHELWPILQPNQRPGQFWYLYPSKPVATTEFHEKWEPEFLPRGRMKDHPVYGWQAEYKNKEIWAIHFNSGVSIYFKTYEQDVQQLQTGTVYAIFCDEELPEEHVGELKARLFATNGYFHMVFTATLGQEIWRRTMEPENDEEEMYRGALKLQVSMYECLTYTDGTSSPWTVERIHEAELSCGTEKEIQKRIHGKFILIGGLKVPSFDRKFNLIKRFPIPSDWGVYSGVDIGSGGEEGHPAAICLLALRPDCKFGVIFKGWRGDGIVTSSSDILEKHTELCTFEEHDQLGQVIKRTKRPMIQTYDWQAKDFFIVASRAGEPFTKAEKDPMIGRGLMNTLFKLRMLAIFDEDPELGKLVVELTSLKEATAKARAKDDFYDSVRFAIMPCPWNFEGVAGEIYKVEETNTDERSEAQKAFDERRPGSTKEESANYDIDAEFEEWQGYIGT